MTPRASSLASLARQPRVILSLIVLGAVTLRLWELGEIPPGVYCDEAAMGTNAMCLATHGTTLKGESWPLWVHEETFERYSSYRIVYQPIYQYTLVPFVGLFGLSAFTVRLPSVLFAALGVLAAYSMGKRMFDTKVGLVGALLLAVSPWHHHYSRICFEVISLPVFLALGTYLVYRGLKESRYLVAGAAVFAVSTYSYPAARLFVPILLLGFFIIYRKELWEARKHAAWGIVTAIVVCLPNIYLLLFDPNQGRMHDLFIWSADITWEEGTKYVREGAVDGGPAAAIAQNRSLLVPFLFLYNYFTHLSPQFLFVAGDTRALYAAQGMGMCYLFVAPLLAVGLWTMIRNWRDKRYQFLLVWFLTWPIPASMTIHAPHATRGMTNFPVLEIIAAVGLWRLVTLALPVFQQGAHRTRTAILASVACFFVMLRFPIEVAGYVNHYHGEFRTYSGGWFEAGIAEAFDEVTKLRQPGEDIYVAPEVFNAYLNILFFADVDYRQLQPGLPDQEGLVPPGWHVAWAWQAPRGQPGTLWLIKTEDLPKYPGATIVSSIPYPDGKPHLSILRYMNKGTTEGAAPKK